MLRHPYILRGPQRQARGAKSEVVPNKGEQNQKRLPHPCLLGGPKEGGNATSPLHSWGFPTKGNKIRTGCLTPLTSRGPKKARKCYVTPAFSGVAQRHARGAKSEVVPNKEEQNQKWLAHTCLLDSLKEGAFATSHQHSPGSPPKGNKITSRSLILAFSEAQKRAEMLRHSCILGDLQQRGQNQKWLPHPYLLGGPKEGGNATSPLHSRGSPTPSTGSKIRSGPLQRGTKSEAAASALLSRKPKRGQKCYVTPAFSGVPNAKRKEQNQKWPPTKRNKIRSGYLCLLGGPKEGGNDTTPLHSRGSPAKGNIIKSGCLTPAFWGAQKRAEMPRHAYTLGDPRTRVQKGPSPGQCKTAPHGGPR